MKNDDDDDDKFNETFSINFQRTDQNNYDQDMGLWEKFP